ncbi:MAG: hypothetical protein RIB93_14715 [Coleofasciculus sp. D1-CHI-01]
MALTIEALKRNYERMARSHLYIQHLKTKDETPIIVRFPSI